jgi:hypothetical protein
LLIALRMLAAPFEMGAVAQKEEPLAGSFVHDMF